MIGQQPADQQDAAGRSSPNVGRATSLRLRALTILARYGTLIILGGVIVLFSILRPTIFPTGQNFVNIANQIALTAIISGGVTIILVAGEFDLSVGFQASLAEVMVTRLLVMYDVPIIVAVAICLVVAIIIGIVNGFIVTKLGVNALITTLGLGTILVGVNYTISGGGTPVNLQSRADFTGIALGDVLGVPNAVVAMAVVLTSLWLLLDHTGLGQQFQAVGGNREAALLSGVKVDRVKIIAFCVAAICASLTGVLLAARIGSSQITSGDGYLLDAFAAAFLGSAALRNGEFHILGTLIGVVTVGVGFNGLAILGAPSYIQFYFKGLLLIVAVALSTAARRLRD